MSILQSQKSRGFTLIELLVVIAIISLLSSIVLSSLNSARAKARDAKRLLDMHQIQTALELYYNDYGYYPNTDSDVAPFFDGYWDSSADGKFITPLVVGGYLPAHILDTSINVVVLGNYKYYKHSAINGGCTEGKAFYILLIMNLESITGVHPSSPGFTCKTATGTLVWDYGAEWMTGKRE